MKVQRSASPQETVIKPQSPLLRIYLAGPLFTIQERRMNREMARAIEAQMPGTEVLLPQDFKHDDRYNDSRAFGIIFKGCIDGIDSCQCMIAWLDGPDSDSGTCFEVGYAYAKGIPVVGVRTDFRDNQERGVNLMLSRSCTAFVYRPSFDEDVNGLARAIVRTVTKMMGSKIQKAEGRKHKTEGRGQESVEALQ